MTSLFILLNCVSGFAILTSFIHLVRYDAWWIRIWDFPHLQLAILILLCLVTRLTLMPLQEPTDWIITGLLVTSLLYQAWLIYPYTNLHKIQMNSQKSDDPSNTLQLMIANIYMDNRNYDRILKQVALVKPDVLLIVEADDAWKEALRPLETDYPHRILQALPNTYGMLLYTRLKMTDPEVRFLIEDDIPSVRVNLQLPSGQSIRFYGVHPQPPSPTEHYRSTERDAELLVIGKEARQHTGPVIVAGDLNDVAWSHTTRLFQRISGLLDPRIGRGLYSTFHAKYFFLRWPLDHIFASHHFKVGKIKRLPNCGSDHFPVFVSLTYSPDPESKKEEPQPEGDDKQEAVEKIEKAKE
ncbi:endonuclease/exonuclease/phosphatase family protein [Tellurirhabdus bombi]|uniref:endonuclease/exonuclease/phosphatase family protein n=1 Tax=Tellurirhabdus bombi TaxID=2907205 RepID=UPI001F3DEFDF|nr:endonuclease/exonuclease/phosphatase family protein [Tellurirhabdus bombi]